MGDGGAYAAGAAGHRQRERAERARTLYFIAAAVLAALVPLILFAGLWVRTVLNQSEQDLRSDLVSHAAELSGRVDLEIKQQLSVMNAIALVQSLDEPNLGMFHAAATRMVGAIPQWAAISLIDPATGRQLVNTLTPFGGALPDVRNPEIIREVSERREPRVFTRYAGESGIDEQGAVFLAVPVVREGALRAVLVVALKTEAIQQLVEHTEDGLLAVLVDERERILARSQDPQASFGEGAADELRTAARGRGAGLFGSNHVYTSFQRSPVTGWLSVITADSEGLGGSSDRSTWALVGTGAVALALAGVLAIFLFYNVVERRVSDERFAASRALGALDARLLKTTQDALAEQRKAASEREVLLREIYHRVKNNLQIIQSLLRLGSRDLSPEQREPFESAIRRIGAMARVHSLLYKSADLASIDLKDYLEDLVEETASGFGADLRGIRTELSAESMRIPLDTAVPLAFITVEILTNAFKHAFPEGRRGTVRVVAFRQGEEGVLSISDDGVGIPAPRGGRQPLGLTLVTKLVEQIDGQLEAPEPGRSTHRVIFPLLAPVKQAATPPPPPA